jgi:VWFA-related protein
VLTGAPLALLLAAPAGQEPPPAQPATVVRVTVGLVQVDAVVTDKQGRPVTDLTPADFVIREGGQEREITHLSYVRLAPPTGSAATEPAPPPVPAPGAKPALAPRVRGRMITIVVDDLNVSFEGISRLRDVLHQYIDTRLAPGDRAAILRTGAGVSVLEQFTSDTARLHAAADGLRYNYEGMAGVGGPAAIDSQMPFGGGPTNSSPSGRQNSQHGTRVEALRREMVEVGTLGALRRIVKGLAPFPGRKPVIVFSDGFRINRRDGLTEPYIRDLTDEANRASVALYTIDARGLQTDAVQAADNVAYLGSDVNIGGTELTGGIPRSRARARFDAEESLWSMADRTGGLMVKSANDPGRGLDRVLADQEGYYLIGYAPPASFFETAGGRPRFHKIQVSVRRPGLHVRSRAGFYGVPDAAAVGTASRGERLAAALVSPFAAADLGLRLRALFVDDEQTGPTLRAMLRIDGRDLTFVERPGGGWQVALDVAAVTYGSGGVAVDRKDQTFTLSTQAAERPGPETAFYYTVDLPVTNPGPYQFRVVVQDTATERLGAAGEVVVVPDVRAGGLALSGILVHGAAGDGPAAEGSDGRQALVGRVKAGGSFDYAFQILNARRDPATERPRLQTQVRLWRGGRTVYEGPKTTLSIEGPGGERAAAGGRLDLGANLEPGDYGLQVIVTDILAPPAHSVATQWARLEVVR